MSRASGSSSRENGRPEPRSAVERVYERTRTAILVGDYAPGMPLRMSHLAAANEVSTIPVREALRRLEAERLVESIPNKGVRVAKLSVEDLADAYKLRTVLEVEAVRLAVPNLDQRDRKRLERLLKDMRRYGRAGQTDLMHEAHRDLHFTVYDKARSAWLEHVISSLWDHTERYRRLASQWLYVSDDLAARHVGVVDALFCGDVERAVQALRDHFQEPQRYLDERLRINNG